MKCLICGENFQKMANHVKFKHGMTPKEYYDKFLKKSDKEGICHECGKLTKFYGIQMGYAKFCSISCSSRNKNKNFSKETWEKIRVSNTNKKRTPEQKERMSKAGKDRIFSDKHRENLKISAKERNNDPNYINPFSKPEVQEKIKQTWLEKYGVDNPQKSKEVQKKSKKTKIIRRPVYDQKILKNKNQRLKENNPQFEIIKELESIHDKYILAKCKKCGKISECLVWGSYTKENSHYNKIRCINCYPLHRSIQEIEICDFLKDELKIEKIVKNSRLVISPLELDFYLPDYNLAIEFDGIYWHGEQWNKDKFYHLNKTKLCNEKDIQLIHIFENEWENKKEIVKSILRSKLNKSEKLCGARQCIIREIDSKIKNSFLEQNHIQGQDRSSIKLGAFYQNKLVSVMTFSRPSIAKGRKDQKSNNFELSRFCNLLNYHIPGIAGKLLSFFKRNYNFIELYTFADIRYSNGNLYEKLGFNKDGISRPNYWYYHKSDRLKLYHRFKFRKSELPELLENFDPKLTEYQNMLNNDYIRIWDCGNLKFKFYK